MAYLVLKVAITAVVVVAVSEISRRSTLIGAVLASMPIVSVLAMIWLYLDTKSVEKVADLSRSILWLIVPSVLFFVLLPVLLRKGLGFFPALGISLAATLGAYLAAVGIAHRLNVAL